MKTPVIAKKFGSHITQLEAESLVEELGRSRLPEKNLKLDFSNCESIDIGAGVLIGNSIRRYAQASMLEIVVPAINSEKDFSGKWYLAFTRSGLGIAIARHAPIVYSANKDITNLLREYYASKAEQASQNSVFVLDIHRGLPVNLNNQDEFTLKFYSWLRYVNVDISIFSKNEMRSLTQLCYEGLQNILDHADRSPLSKGTNILSYFSMRYYKGISEKEKSGLFGPYLKRIKHKKNILASPNFIEIMINDDGVGIPARQSLSEDIYWTPAAEPEQKALTEALSTGSVKLRSHDTYVRGDPGRGYQKIADSLYSLSAYASLRTGRIHASFDGSARTIGTGWYLAKSKFGLNHGYMPGTALEIVVPIPEGPKTTELGF